MSDWQMCSVEHSVICPDCAFTFDAEHTDEDGTGYSCPLCAEVALSDRIERLEAALRPFAAMLDEFVCGQGLVEWPGMTYELRDNCKQAREALGGDDE